MNVALQAALLKYRLEAQAVEPVERKSCYAAAFRVLAASKWYVARVRHIRASPDQVRFACRWAKVISSEVPVPVPLAPPDEVPRVAGRCVDVAPFIEHEHTEAHRAGPEAWVQVGEWVGRMHRLGAVLAEEAPCELLYGNHPHEKLIAALLEGAQKTVPAQHLGLLQRAEALNRRIHSVINAHKPNLPCGVVHGDMHFWNVLYSGSRPVAILDLDFLQRGVLLYDVAYASIWLSTWERQHGAQWRNISARYLAAYERGRQQSLTAAETGCLSWARALHNLHFFFSALQESWEGWEKALPDFIAAEEALRQL